MSTLVSQPAPKPSWKQEVNRRLEAHKSRKGLSVVEEESSHDERGGVSDRAAQAAARVAARFSKAPSYGEMQAAEARAALRNAEVATRAALEAQALAQVALDNLERSADEDFSLEDATSAEQGFVTEAPVSAAAASPSVKVRWEREKPSLAVSESTEMHSRAAEVEQSGSAATPYEFVEDGPTEWVEPEQPIHANLIQFPRELVATRRLRPRLAETAQNPTEDPSGQLSIFEVDPSSISVEPVVSMAMETAVPAPSWSGPEWSSIELEVEPEEAKEYHREPPSTCGTRIDLAPLGLRMMAATIDFALIVAMVCAGGLGIAGHMLHPPAMKTAEMSAGFALLLVTVFYHAFFLLTTMATPGMMYARIALCTFDDEQPTRLQVRDRLGAMLVSLLPVGLGLAWSIFDEDRLSWHDRLSRTYQRRC
ncbi:MAG TPA: RDD family protein [Terracidiphilus sp.]|nr:RDD family protein [Terracidiphilus sp.]